MISRILDPDCKSTWSAFEDLVYAPKIWQKIKAKLNSGEEQEREFLNQLTCSDTFLKDDLARCLRKNGTEILYTRYSHVVGYHGCRPRDRTSYGTNGILPSNTEDLISEARTLFEGIEGFDAALQDIKKLDYLNQNEGKVGLLYSALLAKDNHTSYAQGSELIRSIANRLGSVAKSRFSRTGNPTLIKCKIPVDWPDHHTMYFSRGGYSNCAIEALIRMRMGPEESFIVFGGGYMLKRAVPPENILDFIDMTNFIHDEL